MIEFYELLKKNKKYVIGLMSGTSVDGIDAAVVEITGHGLETKVNLIAFETIPFHPMCHNASSLSANPIRAVLTTFVR